MSDPTVLQSLHNPSFGPVDPWALVTKKHPGSNIPQPALVIVGSGVWVRIGETWPNTRGEALGIHISELLANLQLGALS